MVSVPCLKKIDHEHKCFKENCKNRLRLEVTVMNLVSGPFLCAMVYFCIHSERVKWKSPDPRV